METKPEYPEQITEKYKIWEVENNRWFKPIYPSQKGSKTITETKEILFSQSGEMYLHQSGGELGALHELTHVNQTQFIPFIYTGKKDSNNKRIFVGDHYKVNIDGCKEGTIRGIQTSVVVFIAPEFKLKVIECPILKPGSITHLFEHPEGEVFTHEMEVAHGK